MGLSISYLGDLGGYDTQVTKENKSHGSDKKKNRVKQRLVSPEWGRQPNHSNVCKQPKLSDSGTQITQNKIYVQKMKNNII